MNRYMDKIKAFLLEVFYMTLLNVWLIGMFYYGLVTSPLYGN
jgi:hypothetical protein